MFVCGSNFTQRFQCLPSAAPQCMGGWYCTHSMYYQDKSSCREEETQTKAGGEGQRAITAVITSPACMVRPQHAAWRPDRQPVGPPASLFLQCAVSAERRMDSVKVYLCSNPEGKPAQCFLLIDTVNLCLCWSGAWHLGCKQLEALSELFNKNFKIKETVYNCLEHD